MQYLGKSCSTFNNELRYTREFAEAFCLLNITAKYDESQLQKGMIQDIDYKKKRQ